MKKVTLFSAALYKLFFLTVLCFAVSCTDKKEADYPTEANHSQSTIPSFEADTANALLTLEKIKHIQPPSLADSTYRHFIEALLKSNHFKEAQQHLSSYQSYFNQTPQQKTFAYIKSGEAFSALAKFDSAIYCFSQALAINI